MCTLGTRIKNFRKAYNITQSQLAKHFNVDKGTISRWESDLFEPNLQTLKELAVYFNTSTDYLLGLIEKKH